MLGRASELQLKPCLLTQTEVGQDIFDPIRRLLDAGAAWATRRSNRGAMAGACVVLAYSPHASLFERALGLAGTAPLCVMELFQFPVDGWARATRAVDLTTGDPWPAFPTEVVEELEHVIFVGNNDWTKGPGADSAERTLVDLREEHGFDDLNAVVGYAAAQGKSADALGRLEKIAKRAGFMNPRQPPASVG